MVYNWQDWISRLVLSSFKRICVFFNLVTFALKKKTHPSPHVSVCLQFPTQFPSQTRFIEARRLARLTRI